MLHVHPTELLFPKSPTWLSKWRERARERMRWWDYSRFLQPQAGRSSSKVHTCLGRRNILLLCMFSLVWLEFWGGGLSANRMTDDVHLIILYVVVVGKGMLFARDWGGKWRKQSVRNKNLMLLSWVLKRDVCQKGFVKSRSCSWHIYVHIAALL